MDATTSTQPLAYTSLDTSLGLLMVAATDKGLCFAEFGDSEAALRRQLEQEFPDAPLAVSSDSNAPELASWARALQAHLDQDSPPPSVPLDLRGSEFQRNVWQALSKLRKGEVVSYTELARRLGKPQAVRAVASACGRNRIAVLIPCHRVLRSDGSLGGYRWGLDRKQQLLDRERSAAAH